MLSKIKTSLLIITLLCGFGVAQGQCFSFAKNVGKAKLGNYIHDGNYNATMLGEGEKAELFKTFFEGQKYRICISKVENLPSIHFKVLERSGKVLFDNSKHNYSLTWDFAVESTQMLIVELQVLEQKDSMEDIITGCVAVLFGVEPEKK